MKIALITTTINVPTVLSFYRKLGPSVRFFVAGDVKTPDEAYAFCTRLPDCEMYSPGRQKELGYACSELIGWNTIGRRNIALLEALKWGADVIVTIDDDNVPISGDYFYYLQYIDLLFSGLEATSRTGWFDVGALLDPVAPHRGFPHAKASSPIFSPVIDARIGVLAGICLGDPDISAVTRIAVAPTVHRVSEVLLTGVVTDPRKTWTVFNSQNTTFIRELAPCFLMVPRFGRYDDIFASLVAQRVMREKNLYVRFDQPFVWQQRNQHDLLKDLRAEMWGQEHILEFAGFLDAAALEASRPVIDMVDYIYGMFGAYREMYENAGSIEELSRAWIADCRKVTG
jgi:hypothetical protein